MPIVTCPSCRRRYDPGVAEELGDLPGNMSMKVVCPACGQWLRLPEKEPIDPPAVPAEILREMASQSRLVDAEEQAPSSRRSRDQDEDRPRRERSAAEDDDDRPRRRRRDEYDDEEEDDRPRRSPRDRYDDERDDFDDYPGRKPGDGLGTASMIVGIFSCVCSLGCCVPYLGFVSGPLSIIGGITAIIMGFVSRSQNRKSGKALAGIITGFAALLIDILMVVIVFLLGFGMAMNK